MGMWDYYRPKEVIQCPLCKGKISGWQGKDGRLCNLFLYVEEYKHPFIIHWTEFPNIDNVDFLNAPQDTQLELPNEFYIYGDCSHCGGIWTAKCYKENEVWSKTILITEHNLGELVADDDVHLEGMMWEIYHNRRRYKEQLENNQEKES
jgi:hypothetical protein